MKNSKIAIIACIVLSFIGGLSISRYRVAEKSRLELGTGITRSTELITVRDTVFVHSPIAKSETKGREKIIGLPSEAIREDSISSDSVEVTLPTVTKKYSGDDYEAWVSGIEPQLDSLIIFRTTEKVLTTEKIISSDKRGSNNRWSVGVTVGIGYRRGKIDPYAGIGVSYRLF